MPNEPPVETDKWTLKRVQGDGRGYEVAMKKTCLQFSTTPMPQHSHHSQPPQTPTPSPPSSTPAAPPAAPRASCSSHANLALGAVSVAQYLELKPDDKTLAVLPLSFDYGQNQLLSTWRAGGCVVPLDYLTPRDVIKACAKHGITTLAAVPPLWVQLAEQDWPAEATENMRRLTNSGGALTPSLVKMLRSIFGSKTAHFRDVRPDRSLPLDLSRPRLDRRQPDQHGARASPLPKSWSWPPTAAKPRQTNPANWSTPGHWSRKVTGRTKPAPPNASNPHRRFREYGGMAVWSGDTVRRDADGLFYFVGRDDAMIKTSGNRVSPTEIEEAAVESGLVAEACALGRKDERLGAAIVLFVRGQRR